MNFAVLNLSAPDNLVAGWFRTGAEAIKAAEARNAANDGGVYRAVRSGWDGLWRSLTGESLYV